MRDEGAVVIGVYVFTGTERHTAKRHRNVEITDAALVGLHGMTGQGLNAKLGLRENIDVTNATVDNQTFPTIACGFLGKHVTQQRTTQRAAAIDHQHLARTVDVDLVLDQRIVLATLDVTDLATKGIPTPPETGRATCRKRGLQYG